MMRQFLENHTVFLNNNRQFRTKKKLAKNVLQKKVLSSGVGPLQLRTYFNCCN